MTRLLLGLVWAIACLAQSTEELLKLLTPSSRTATARINAVDRSWEDWLKRTGASQPDFLEMRSQPMLPDPLEGVRTRADWQKRREWIRAEYEKWIFGRMPPPPGNVRAVVTDSRSDGGVKVREVRLEFGPSHKATLRLQLIIPPGKGPFPVFLTNHPRTRPWIVPAVRRGYIGCIYYAADPIYGSPDDSDPYIEIYPEYDFSALARWAWAAMRAVDYLVGLPEVDKARIGIAGHSRNGKQALLAAAFDDRIGAAVPSSGNTGEGDAWRYTTDTFANETIEQITGNFPGWFHPRFRFFAGREHKLPVDQNMLMAMIAPRGLLMASAYAETQGNHFGFEQAYRSVRKVYEFLGARDKVGLALRAGEHPTTAEDIERYVDFFDSVFGRSKRPPPETFVHGYTFERWKQLSGESIDPALGKRDGDLRTRIQWLLGDEPPVVPFPNRKTIEGRTMTNEGWIGGMLGRPLSGKGFKAFAVPFGDDLKADLYMPDPAPAGKLPAVIWLHSYSYPTGYSRYAGPLIRSFIEHGIAVLSFDQIGFGTRIHQATRFYERYPHWSLLGKMVGDTRAAVDALSALDGIDASRIYLAGYHLGGKIALFTAALDPRVAAVSVSGAFTPLRHTSAHTEGLHHYATLHGLVPRLGFFLRHESRVPVDYDEILASIGRPVLIRAPLYDRYADAAAVRKAVESARTNGRVELREPSDFNRMAPAAQREFAVWLSRLQPNP